MNLQKSYNIICAYMSLLAIRDCLRSLKFREEHKLNETQIRKLLPVSILIFSGL